MDKIRHISTTEKKQWEKRTVNNSIEGELLKFTDKEYQRIEGFGGCFNELGWIAMNKLKKN